MDKKLTVEQKECALNRLDKIDWTIEDYERQYSFSLPVPWKETVRKLTLGGLADHELHLIFITLLQVEFQAGRLKERTLPSWEE